MLKFAFLLVFLLNSVQISTASDECGLQCIVNLGCKNYYKSKENLPIEEQKKLDASTEYVNSILKQENQNEKLIDELNFEKMKLQGAKVDEANKEINALDKIPFKYGWIEKSHVELCPEFHDLRSKNFSGLSIYNFTFLSQYDNFGRSLSKIPESEMDVKKLNVFFYYFSDEQRRMEVAQKVHEFSQRLQCLQSIKSSDNTEFIGKMIDLYEAFCYTAKFSQERKAQCAYTGPSDFLLFMILIAFILVCRCLYWCCCQ